MHNSFRPYVPYEPPAEAEAPRPEEEDFDLVQETADK